jgi:hypothetical protein
MLAGRLHHAQDGAPLLRHADSALGGPTSVNGNMNSSNFGQVVGAASPRLMQAAVKLIF